MPKKYFCPCLVQPSRWGGTCGGNWSRRFLRTRFVRPDFTPESAAAAPYAVGLSNEFDAQLFVCHLLNMDELRSANGEAEVAQQYSDAVHRTLPDGETSWCSPHAQLEHATTADDILKRAKDDTAA